jgi:hypothetical protein
VGQKCLSVKGELDPVLGQNLNTLLYKPAWLLGAEDEPTPLLLDTCPVVRLVTA